MNPQFICKAAVEFFKTLDKNNDTNDDRLARFNTRSNSNIYLLDKFGLVIRKNDMNKQSPTGYFKDEEGELVNINVDKTLLHFNPENALNDTIDLLYRNPKFPKNGVVSKIYHELYPEHFK